MLRSRMILLAAPVLAAGCGGGGGGGTTPAAKGTVSFHIVWPARTAQRVIPLGSQSVVLTLKDTNGVIDVKGTIVRPNTSWTSASLIPGSLTFQAAAYPTVAGTGTPSAVGAGNVTVVANQDTSVTPVLGSTVKKLTVSASSNTAIVGTSFPITATALDASNSAVLVDTATLGWSSSDTSVATVGATGVVTPVKIGACTITATFNEVEPSLGQTPVVSQPFSLTVQGGTTTITIH